MKKLYLFEYKTFTVWLSEFILVYLTDNQTNKIKLQY